MPDASIRRGEPQVRREWWACHGMSHFLGMSWVILIYLMKNSPIFWGGHPPDPFCAVILQGNAYG